LKIWVFIVHIANEFILLSSTHEGEITKASIFMARPLQSSHTDKRCGIQDTEEPQVKDDGSAPGPAGTLSGSCSGHAALSRECYELSDNGCLRKTLRHIQE
jgi:hypothetical protein